MGVFLALGARICLFRPISPGDETAQSHIYIHSYPIDIIGPFGDAVASTNHTFPNNPRDTHCSMSQKSSASRRVKIAEWALAGLFHCSWSLLVSWVLHVLMLTDILSTRILPTSFHLHLTRSRESPQRIQSSDSTSHLQNLRHRQLKHGETCRPRAVFRLSRKWWGKSYLLSLPSDALLGKPFFPPLRSWLIRYIKRHPQKLLDFRRSSPLWSSLGQGWDWTHGCSGTCAALHWLPAPESYV